MEGSLKTVVDSPEQIEPAFENSPKLVNLLLDLLSRNSLKIMLTVMTFSLAVWSMILPRWIRIAIIGAFMIGSTVTLRLSFPLEKK